MKFKSDGNRCNRDLRTHAQSHFGPSNAKKRTGNVRNVGRAGTPTCFRAYISHLFISLFEPTKSHDIEAFFNNSLHAIDSVMRFSAKKQQPAARKV